MENKVILICIDGMRADGFLTCGNAYAQELMKLGAYSTAAQSVLPSITLPAHMSIFHSVPPQRHGILTNTYTPLVRPLNGICEQIKNAGGVNAIFYGWEPMRDISRPGSMKISAYLDCYLEDGSDAILTDAALACMRTRKPDFVFLYMAETDDKGGHAKGWMTPDYMHYVSAALDNVKRVVEEMGSEYTVILTADHGGHDRSHGTDMPEDMTIPMVFIGNRFTPGKQLENLSLLDIAPTIADVMGVPAEPEWEGRSVAE